MRAVVRELRLSRRRSRLPWVYVVYHPPCRRDGLKGATRNGRLAQTAVGQVPPAAAGDIVPITANPQQVGAGTDHASPPPDAIRPSALAPEERGYVERRIQVEAVLLW